MAYLAVPPTTWLFYSGEAQTHYTLGLLLCALLLLSTFKLWQAQSWKWHGPFIWGLIAGAAIWTIFSSAIVVLPCGIFLLLTGKKRLGALPIAWALAGITIGAFPLIWFNITHGMVHFNQASVFSSRYIIPNIQSYLRNALPLILGINTPIVGRPASPAYLYETCYFLILALMAAGIFFLFRFSRGKYTPFAFLLMAVLSLNVIIVLTSAYGKALVSPDQRYLLIAYLILPFLVGASIKAAAEKRQWLGIAMLTALALVHVSQYVGFARWDRGLLNIKSGFFFSREAKFKRTLQEIRAAGFKDIYTSQDSLKMDFFG